MTATGATPRTTVAAVREVDGGVRQDLRGVKIVWQREMMRFAQDRLRIVSALIQPVLFLFVLGTGLSSLTDGSTGGVDLRTFMFPGVLAISAMFTAMFSAASIVWDREFGFLREMLVAPVRRGSILIGKSLGGATVATMQSMIILALAGTVGVPYDAGMIVVLIGELFLLSFALTTVGLVIAARVQQMQSMMGVMQMLLLPLSFLSGALYPLANLPAWLKTITLLNPITYAVHAIRSIVFDHLDAPASAVARLNPPLRWFGWTVPIAVQLAVVVVVGAVLLSFAVLQFNRTE
ncbi:MAG: ABC transporter permease [Actinomycetota bacterium]|nr:ABC transporter permease [Actinomycetota bacterium]